MTSTPLPPVMFVKEIWRIFEESGKVPQMPGERPESESKRAVQNVYLQQYIEIYNI